MEITWDLFVLIAFGALSLYGAFVGRNKILGVLVNVYIAIAITLLAGEAIFDVATNIPQITENLVVTKFGILTLTMALAAGLLTIKSELSGLDSGDSLSKAMGGTYGFFAAWLILSAVFGFMSTAELINLNSNFALIVTSLAPGFAVAPVALMIISTFFRKGKKKK